MNRLRSEIKHNFLKQIIFRLDYEGIMDSDIEKCIVSLRETFLHAGFKKMENRTENQFDVQIKMDLNISDDNAFSINNNNKSIVYSFYSEKKEILEISKNFFTLTVDIDEEHGYKRFDKYVNLLAESIKNIKEISPYFQVQRIGLRKINICLLQDLNKVPNYFTNAAFNIKEVVDQFEECDCLASNIVTVFTKDKYQVNYVRNIQQGIVKEDDRRETTTYQIVLDVDVFKEGNREILPLLIDVENIKSILETQNTIEFEIFIKSLNDEFITELKQDVFKDSAIKGVI